MLTELLTLPIPDLLAVGPLPAVTIPDVDPDMDSRLPTRCGGS